MEPKIAVKIKNCGSDSPKPGLQAPQGEELSVYKLVGRAIMTQDSNKTGLPNIIVKLLQGIQYIKMICNNVI